MKSQKMKAILLAGIIVFESVFAGSTFVKAQTISGNEIVTAKEAVSENTAALEADRQINTENALESQGEEAESEPAIKYQGVDGKIIWSIDENGHLLLEGDGDKEGSADWLNNEDDLKSKIKTATVKVKNITSMSTMFYQCVNLESVDFSGSETGAVTDMSSMFKDCVRLKSVNFGDIDTSNVTNMHGVFWRCLRLEDVDVSNFNTSNVTDMGYMFYGCNSLISLDLSNFDTSKVTDMFAMFDACWKLESLDISGFDTSKVTNMYSLFYDCHELTNLDLSNFDTSNVTNMSRMFYNCRKLETLNISNWDTQAVTDMSYMFYNCEKLTALDLNGFDTSKLTNMTQMFYNCRKLETLNISNWDTQPVTDMSEMFYNCEKLTALDLSGFDTSKLTNMTQMFYNCRKLETLNISNWDTQAVTDMSYMFYECKNLKEPDVANFNTGKVTNTKYMFYRCESIMELDLSNWNLESLAENTSMLERMNNLLRLALPNIPVSLSMTYPYYDENNVPTTCAKDNIGEMTYRLKVYADSYCCKNGHTYCLPIFIWAKDYSSAKVYLECTREDCKYDVDDKHLQMDAAVTKQVIEPTYEKEGAVIYTATAAYKGKIYKEVKQIVIPKLTKEEETKPETQKTPENMVGNTFGFSGVIYKVTKLNGKEGEIAYLGPKNKKVKSVTIPATVEMGGVSYKVTSVADNALKNYKNLTKVTIGKNVTKIGKNAFYGCKKLKKVVIKSKKLKSIGKNAFKGIYKKAKIDVPNAKKKAYRKLLKTKTGYKKTMVIK